VIARLQALGTAMPERVYKQSEIVESFFGSLPGWDPGWSEVFEASGIERRAAVIDVHAFYAGQPSTAERMRAFTPAARRLGTEAARRALELAGPDAVAEVGDLVVVSCTGYAGPGLDLHLACDLGLGLGTRRLALGHMGCYASLPALRTAAALVAASGQRALVVSVELCSLHLQPATSRQEAVSQALFGDGAAAALIGPGEATGASAAIDLVSSAGPATGVPGPRGRGPGGLGGPAAPRGLGSPAGPGGPGGPGGPAGPGQAVPSGLAIVAARTATLPGSQDRMGWLIDDDGFHMSLSPRVPALVDRGLGALVEQLLGPHGLAPADIAHWAVHPGGPEILDRVQRRLGLTDAQLAPSREVLADGGNRSSATVLFILESVVASGELRPGQWLVTLGFGTGLTLEALLLRA
jgi:predicted naringenin-chalcone synthase